jgi:hypothetical protein
MHCGPGDDSLEFGQIVLNRGDLGQFFFNHLYVSHDRTLSRIHHDR